TSDENGICPPPRSTIRKWRTNLRIPSVQLSQLHSKRNNGKKGANWNSLPCVALGFLVISQLCRLSSIAQDLGFSFYSFSSLQPNGRQTQLADSLANLGAAGGPGTRTSHGS